MRQWFLRQCDGHIKFRRTTIKIYVGNLSYNTTDQDLRSAFAAYGNVADATVISDRETNRSRGFGFVEMPEQTEAEAAMRGLNGQDLGGRILTVNEAKPRTDRPQSSGRRRSSW